MLSLLLRFLVVDDLLNKLHNDGYNVQGNADELVIAIKKNHNKILSNRR